MKEYFMRKALEEAKKAKVSGDIPIGAVIVKDEKIIASAHNLKEKNTDPTAHAEILAIKKACEEIGDWRLEGCEMYVNLEPCAMCAGAILNARIKKLYVGTKDFRMGACGTAIDLSKVESFNHKFEVDFGVLEEESRKIISEFFVELRNKKK